MAFHDRYDYIIVLKCIILSFKLFKKQLLATALSYILLHMTLSQIASNRLSDYSVYKIVMCKFTHLCASEIE